MKKISLGYSLTFKLLERIDLILKKKLNFKFIFIFRLFFRLFKNITEFILIYDFLYVFKLKKWLDNVFLVSMIFYMFSDIFDSLNLNTQQVTSFLSKGNNSPTSYFSKKI